MDFKLHSCYATKLGLCFNSPPKTHTKVFSLWQRNKFSFKVLVLVDILHLEWSCSLKQTKQKETCPHKINVKSHTLFFTPRVISLLKKSNRLESLKNIISTKYRKLRSKIIYWRSKSQGKTGFSVKTPLKKKTLLFTFCFWIEF